MRYRAISRYIAVIGVIMYTGCGPLPDPRALYAGDLQSPVYLGSRTVSSTAIEVAFHETIVAQEHEYSCEPDIPILNVSTEDSTVRVEFSRPMVPGGEYALYGRVEDGVGNSMRFITKLYGYNPQIPLVKINEFNTRGSGKHPDCVELLVESPGNLAGVTIYEGTSTIHGDSLVFPPVAVVAGDYIVVHFKPEGIAEEIDETASPDVSGGYDASNEAWDFWVFGGDGLSGNNGVVSVYDNPSGSMIDAIIYSNRTSASDDTYAGFGSRIVMEQAECLLEEDAWYGIDGMIRPEDAIDPEGNTGTRTICRRKGTDSNSKSDWYIVATRCATFGSENSTEVYVDDD